MNTMNMPGFTAEASVYRTRGHYWVAGTPNDFAGGQGVLPQLSLGLSGSQLYWCRLACAYCSYYGLYCWGCYICAWIIVLGGETNAPN